MESAPLLKYLCFKNMAVLATKRQEWAEAVDHFAKAVSIDGTDVVVWYRMGMAAYAGRYLSVARYALEQGLGINPQHWLTAKLLVQVLSAMGNDVASTTLGRYLRAADPTYQVGEPVENREAPNDGAPGAKRQCTSIGEGERSVGTTKQRLKLTGASPSWQELAQELVALAVKSVQQGETGGFRDALHVEIVPTECATGRQPSTASEETHTVTDRERDTQADAQRDNNHPSSESQANRAASSPSPEKVASTDKLESDTDAHDVEESQSLPGSSPRKSERKKRPNRRAAGEQDDQPVPVTARPEGGGNMQGERATSRLAKFTGAVPDDVEDRLLLSTPSSAREVATISAAAGAAAPSLLKFVAKLQRENHSLLAVIRMVLTDLCSDVQRLLPKTLCSEILRMHSILKKHSSVGLCRPCNIFLAELYFSAHQTTSSDDTKARMLCECCNLIGSIHYDELGPDSSHESTKAQLQARLCWLRGQIAESAQEPSTAHACYVSCLAWMQHTGIDEIVVANAASEKSISASAAKHRLGALDENDHTNRISQLFAAGQHDEFISETAPRLEKKRAQATPEQWCTLLNQLLESSEKTSRWDLLLQCHMFRLQYALSTKCDPAYFRIMLCGTDNTTRASDGSIVAHEVRKLLVTLQRCAQLNNNTWCSADRAAQLLCFVARSLESLEMQGVSAATQHVLVAWECFARLWLIRNGQDVPKTELVEKCGAYSSLAREIKRSCDSDNQTTAVGGVDTMARQSLVRVLAVGLLKLLHAANENGVLGRDTSEEDKQEGNDATDTYYDARELLDWCLFDLHGIEFPEATGSHQHRQKKDRDHVVHISPGMEAEEAFYWYWYAGQHDFTTVLGTYAKKWKDLQLQFIDLVQKASQGSFPYNETIDNQIDAIILGTQASHDATAVKEADLTGVSRIHLILHHELATIKHSYMNQTFFEDNNIDQPTRRGQLWGCNWDKELRELAVLYRRDLSVNPTRADSWQSLGQCYFRLLDNLLDQHVLGNAGAVQNRLRADAEIFCGSAMEYNERARHCFLRALELDPSSHEPLDLLGFLAFVQIRHGYRQEEVVSEAVDRFTKADNVAQQNNTGADEWMYPFMLGKLRELQGAPPTTWMPLYWTAKRRHKDMCDKADKAELIYRLHASRLKAALILGDDDEESWRLLLRHKSNSAAVDDDPSLQRPLAERRKAVVDSATSKLLGLLKKGERNAWGLEGMKWFYKSRYAVASAFLQLGEPKRAAKQLGALFDTEKERARHFWKMHTYKLTDFGDFSFITERHYDRWRMKCLYLYVHLLTVLQDKCSAAVREKCADAETSLVLAKQRRDKAESSSSKIRWQQDVTNAQAEFEAARREAERGQLLKLERALKRGNDKRVMNRRWTDEARLVALAARYVVLVEKTEKLEEKDDESGVPEVVAHICDTVEHDAESSARSVLLVGELKRADKWLRDVYELYCGIRTYTADTARVPAPAAARAPPPAAAAAAAETSTAATSSATTLPEVASFRCFSELVVSEPPALENLTAKSNCLQLLSERGLEINDFSEQQVLRLLCRRFSRFTAAGSESAPVSPEVIVSYCDKIFSKFPLEDKELADTVLVHSHVKACADASAAAAEKSEKDLAAKVKLAAAKAARENTDVEEPPSHCAMQSGNTATALRAAASAGRAPGLPSPPLKPKQKTKRKSATAPEAVDFEVTLRAYLCGKMAGEPPAQRTRLVK